MALSAGMGTSTYLFCLAISILSAVIALKVLMISQPKLGRSIVPQIAGKL
jgi:hypothetical protein